MTKKKTLPLLLALATLIAAVAVAALLTLRARTANSEPRRLDLPQGTTCQALCDSLDASPTFRLMAKALGLESHVHPGSYIVEPHMSELALARKLRNGQQDPIRLTIGKFRTPQQLNQYLASKLMHDDFDIPLDSFHLVRPDTYEVYWTVSPQAFMQRMHKEYDRFWQSRSLTGLDNPREVIILASIVDEETNYNPEKPHIASVYLNRLRLGMPLQADPTVKYAVGDFTLRRILNRHLAVESPFNTYLHRGLPPAPICLPSAASVDAVLHAPTTRDLYFCASPALDGTHRFAPTLAEHNRNAAAYHRAI